MTRYLVALAAVALVVPLPAQTQGRNPMGAEMEPPENDTVTARYLEALSQDRGGEVAPEPATMALVASGLIGMMGASVRQRRKQRQGETPEP